jgi:hypothetical protein
MKLFFPERFVLPNEDVLVERQMMPPLGGLFFRSGGGQARIGPGEQLVVCYCGCSSSSKPAVRRANAITIITPVLIVEISSKPMRIRR